MSERAKYIRISTRSELKDMECWTEGYVFTGEHYVNPFTGKSYVSEVDIFGNHIRNHLSESVTFTLKE